MQVEAPKLIGQSGAVRQKFPAAFAYEMRLPERSQRRRLSSGIRGPRGPAFFDPSSNI